MSITGIKETISDFAIFYNNVTCLSDINCKSIAINTSAPCSGVSLDCRGQLFTYGLSVCDRYSLLQNSNDPSSNYQLDFIPPTATSGAEINTQNLNGLIGDNQNLSFQRLGGTITLNGNSTFTSSLNVSGNTILNNTTSINSSLNVSGNTILNNTTSINSSLTVSGLGKFEKVNLTGSNNPSFAIAGNLTIGYNTTSQYYSTSANIGDSVIKCNVGQKLILQSGDVSGSLIIDTYNNLILNKPITCSSKLNVSGLSVFDNNVSMNNSLNVSGPTSINQCTVSTSLNVSGPTSINQCTVSTSLNCSGPTYINQCTILSSLYISGRTIIGSDINNFSDSVVEVYKNFTIRKNVLNVVGTGEKLELNVGASNTGSNTVSYLNMEEGKNINLYASIGNINLNATKVNILNDLNIIGSVHSNNISTQKPFTFNCSTVCTINGTTYYRYDIDLTTYTTYTTTTSGSQLRKFKWMSWLTSGAHKSGQYNLNYEIDYANALNVVPISYNGLNVVAYGFPTDNINLTQVNPNGSCLLAVNFNQISLISNRAASFQAIIIDYLF